MELCAGTAALSLRLARGGARPPVSRMGSKAGYSDAILSRMGLYPGEGAGHYLWSEPDPGCRLLLEAYRSRTLALAAAEHIRGWVDEEPRALWERLREEGPAKCPPVDPREVARWALMGAWSYRQGIPDSGPAVPGECHQTERPGIATRLASLPTLDATVTDDARTVDPREVARWAYFAARALGGPPGSSYVPEDNPHPGWGGRGASRPCIARRLASLPTLPATLTDDARTVDPPQLPDGSWVYIDPPYQGTTGYGHALGRAEVVALARRWREAGAHVAVSEAEPISDLVDDGWSVVDLTRERVGQKRTFSKQQREVLTMSRTPRGQLDLWSAP